MSQTHIILMLYSLIVMSFSSTSSATKIKPGVHISMSEHDEINQKASLSPIEIHTTPVNLKHHHIPTESVPVAYSTTHNDENDSNLSSTFLSTTTFSNTLSSKESNEEENRFPDDLNHSTRSSLQSINVSPSFSPQSTTPRYSNPEIQTTQSHPVPSHSALSLDRLESDPKQFQHKNQIKIAAHSEYLLADSISSASVVREISIQTSIDTSSDAREIVFQRGDLKHSSFSSEFDTQEYSWIEPSSTISTLEQRNSREKYFTLTPQLKKLETELSGEIQSAWISQSVNSVSISEASRTITQTVNSLASKSVIKSTTPPTRYASQKIVQLSHNLTTLPYIGITTQRETPSPYTDVDSSSRPEGQNKNSFEINNLENNSTNDEMGVTSTTIVPKQVTSILNHATRFNRDSKIVNSKTESDLGQHLTSATYQRFIGAFTTTTPPPDTTSEVNTTTSGHGQQATKESQITSHLLDLCTHSTASSSSANVSPSSPPNITTVKPTQSDVSTLKQILFQTLPNSIHQNISRNLLTTNSTILDSNEILDNSSDVNNSTKPSSLSGFPTISNESQLRILNSTHPSTQPENMTQNSSSGILAQTNLTKSECGCSSDITNGLKRQIHLLRKYLFRNRSVKSAQNGITLNGSDFASRKSQGYSSTQNQPDNGLADSSDQLNSGIVCYDDRMSITSQEVECPKPTMRKMTLEDHHLQQLLKNEEGNTAHSYIGEQEFETIDANTDLYKINHTLQLSKALQSLLSEQILFHQNLRQLIKDSFMSSTTRDIVSLTGFLKTYMDKIVQEKNYELWKDSDFYLYCTMKEVNTDIIRYSYNSLENEMLDSDSLPTEKSNNEDMLASVQYYTYRSSKLLRLKEVLQFHLVNLNKTFGVVSHISSRRMLGQPHMDSNTKDASAKGESYSTSNRVESHHPKDKNDVQKSAARKNHSSYPEDCPRLVSDFEAEFVDRNPTTTSSTHTKNELDDNSESDMSTTTSREGNHVSVTSGLFESVSGMLKALTIAENPPTTKALLNSLEDRSESLRHDLLELKHKRSKRSVAGASGDTCHDQGSRIPGTDFHLMCSTCVKTTKLSSDYFPRHITEKTCKNNRSTQAQSGSVQVEDGCLNEGGKPGGLCQQQTMTILLLHRNEGKCMKIVSRGREFITDQWKLMTYKLRTGCECVVDKNSQFAQYLTFV